MAILCFTGENIENRVRLAYIQNLVDFQIYIAFFQKKKTESKDTWGFVRFQVVSATGGGSKRLNAYVGAHAERILYYNWTISTTKFRNIENRMKC